MNARTKTSIADIAVCFAFIVLAAVILLSSGKSDGNSVLIKTADQSYTYKLSEDRTEVLYSAGHTLTLEIKGGAVRILDSDCPDMLCVSSGWVSDPSELIVCAPAEVLVRIQNSEDCDDADFIAGR